MLPGLTGGDARATIIGMRCAIACLLLLGCSSPSAASIQPDPSVKHDGPAGVDAGTPGPSDTSEAEVSTEPCDKSFTSGAATVKYAEHNYPGAKMADLVNVMVILPGSSVGPSGYSILSTATHVRDGAAVALCGSATSVTFVRR